MAAGAARNVVWVLVAGPACGYSESTQAMVDPDTRRSMANLLQAVLDVVDPDTGGDIQLIDVHVNVTADPAAVRVVGDRATAAGARWREEELDF